MFITIALLVVGLLILCGGLYYLAREKQDAEARKIYSVASSVGALLAVAVVVKIAVVGL